MRLSVHGKSIGQTGACHLVKVGAAFSVRKTANVKGFTLPNAAASY
jgi:hypothetical protein